MALDRVLHGNQAPRTVAEVVAERLFIGVYPAGIVYADRKREERGDYKRLGFLPYRSLEIQIDPNCPSCLRTLVEAHAATIQARRGQRFEVSTCGQHVILGA